MNIAFPLSFDPLGRTARADDAAHIRDLIMQLLFTSPGERVNRPDLGSGLMQLVFAPNSAEMAAATQFLVQGALQKWLSDLIVVDAVRIESIDSVLQITIQYMVRKSREHLTLSVPIGGPEGEAGGVP
jgi:phage baseplate assembly protein W